MDPNGLRRKARGCCRWAEGGGTLPLYLVTFQYILESSSSDSGLSGVGGHQSSGGLLPAPAIEPRCPGKPRRSDAKEAGERPEGMRAQQADPLRAQLERLVQQAEALQAGQRRPASKQQHASHARQALPTKSAVQRVAAAEAYPADHVDSADSPAAGGDEAAAIPAFRPPSPARAAGEPGSVTREVEAAIARSVESLLCTPPAEAQHARPAQEQELEQQPPPQAAAAAPARALPSKEPSPAYLTAKNRSLYCEMDDPGRRIPYPRARGGGPLARLLRRVTSCFAPPPRRSPARTPAPAQHAVRRGIRGVAAVLGPGGWAGRQVTVWV